LTNCPDYLISAHDLKQNLNSIYVIPDHPK